MARTLLHCYNYGYKDSIAINQSKTLISRKPGSFVFLKGCIQFHTVPFSWDINCINDSVNVLHNVVNPKRNSELSRNSELCPGFYKKSHVKNKNIYLLFNIINTRFPKVLGRSKSGKNGWKGKPKNPRHISSLVLVLLSSAHILHHSVENLQIWNLVN